MIFLYCTLIIAVLLLFNPGIKYIDILLAEAMKRSRVEIQPLQGYTFLECISVQDEFIILSYKRKNDQSCHSVAYNRKEKKFI